MDLPDLITIGTYTEADAAAMEAEYAVHPLTHPDEIAGLPAELRGRARAIAYKTSQALTGAHMDMLPALGIVGNFGVGFDPIDTGAAQARGVRVTNTPGVLSDDVADLAVAMLIARSRHMIEAAEWVRSGRWAREGAMPLTRTIAGKRAGILGLGRIGREIADRLAASKMEIHYHSRSAKATPEGWSYHADPVAMAAEVDFLVVAVVGGAATEGFVTAAMLRALGPEGILVNISRGSVIDEAALLDALEAGTIAGAALDVFQGEPDPDPRFRALDNVVLQPHQASATVETRAAMGQLQRDNIAAFLAGRELPTPVA